MGPVPRGYLRNSWSQDFSKKMKLKLRSTKHPRTNFRYKLWGIQENLGQMFAKLELR